MSKFGGFGRGNTYLKAVIFIMSEDSRVLCSVCNKASTHLIHMQHIYI